MRIGRLLAALALTLGVATSLVAAAAAAQATTAVVSSQPDNGMPYD
jgi:uncharacterized membrane protein YphA (DoxX/SURF4 family)